ncbi:MAG: RNA polymerase sigma factor [Coprobacillus sp.]
MNEKFYIRRIKKGDHQALDIFIENLYPQVYTFILRKVKGDDVAQDLTQEVFVRFIKALPTYEYQKKTLNYLYRISSHVCLSYYKKQRYDYEIEEEHIEDKRVDVHEAIIKQFHHDELIEAVRLLKPLQQDVIILKYFEQYTFKEIADIYNENISTIKSRHYQALIHLKKIMEGVNV